jgi:hypothetical protein
MDPAVAKTEARPMMSEQVAKAADEAILLAEERSEEDAAIWEGSRPLDRAC